MSRTIRRKGWENTARVNGSKTNGFYTTWDRFEEYPSSNGHGGCPVYRAMTKEEVRDRRKRIHGESKHNNAWGPNYFYRKVENERLKTFNKREMKKWKVFGNEYEPMIISRFKRSARYMYMWW